ARKWISAPGPSFNSSPISIFVRPSTADTCTGTSNTASRSEAPRVDSLASGARVTSVGIGPLLRSSSGSGTLGSSLIASLQLSLRAGARRHVAADRFGDRGLGRGAIARHATSRPFDAAIAWRHAGLGEHHQPPLKPIEVRDLLQPRLRDFVDLLRDTHDDVRRGD